MKGGDKFHRLEEELMVRNQPSVPQSCNNRSPESRTTLDAFVSILPDMEYHISTILAWVMISCMIVGAVTPATEPPDISLDWIEEPPEGYYAFIESPNAEPPKVRRPPYVQSDIDCPGLKKGGKVHPSNQRTISLCGDLNKGYIPKNPLRQNVLGHAYPFELIKNKTLQYFSKTLPILKADETLPKVAKYKYTADEENSILNHHFREKREVTEPQKEEEKEKDEEVEEEVKEDDVGNSTVTTTSGKRTARKFCDTSDGMLCVLYKALQGDSLLSALSGQFANNFSERREDVDLPEYRRGEQTLPQQAGPNREPPLPPTPCPAKVEYATPVFARNYQGVWRYVVQIPYEGYFTQTIEVTRCLNSRCHYMEGGCMSSPRWTSILVAEIYYPDSFIPPRPKATPTAPSDWSASSQRQPVAPDSPPPVQDFQNYQQYLQKRAGTPVDENEEHGKSDKRSTHCDGVDEIGCFQVRLYYDWFLVPGSCKCWRPDYFSRYMRRKSSTEL